MGRPRGGKGGKGKAEGEAVALTARVSMFEFGQNDPKMDSGSRLVRFGLAGSMKPDTTFHGIVLSPNTTVCVSPKDRDIVLSAGVAGVNCSWNRVEEIPWDRLARKGHARTLPLLIAANTVNYGKAFKLNTAEAIAATLAIVGLLEDAEKLLAPFSWGEEFLRLNEEALEEYAGAEDSAGVRRAQERMVARCREEAEARRGAGMDLPPSESEEDDEDVEAAAEEAPPEAAVEPVEEHKAAAVEAPKAPIVPVEEHKDAAVEAPPAAKEPVVPAERPRPAPRPAAPVAPVPEAPQEPARPEVPSDAPAPKLQKAVLAALQAAAPAEWLKERGLQGLSGNALAKIARRDFEAAWAGFREEVAPGLSLAKLGAVLAAAAGDAAAKPGKGRGRP